jgi:spore coat polysaccharide biosynthesis predicted glycosyltransferase SpsG
MGHLFRALNLADGIRARGEQVWFFLNEHVPSLELISARGYGTDVVDLHPGAAWEVGAIARHEITLWVNDRLDTVDVHVRRVINSGIPVVTFDDRGTGAALTDANIAGLSFGDDPALAGRRVFRGVDYLILNPSIAKHRRQRSSVRSILVTLGGADTHGVTFRVAPLLRDFDGDVTIVLGPGFVGDPASLAWPKTRLATAVPSLIEEMGKHDLAITGGGITPFEANASGLPCVVVANERFEVPVGEALQAMGGCRFAGYHETIDPRQFDLNLPVAEMSRAAMDHIGLGGLERVIDIIWSLRRS